MFATGYRSPLRPIPWDIIPETVHHEGSGVHNLEQYNDENTANNSTPDSWWLEAMRFADNVERMPDLSELSKMVSLLYSLAKNSVRYSLAWKLKWQRKHPCSFLFEFNLFLFSANTKQENISDDEDENWWLAVERAVSQTELSHVLI